MEVMNWVLAVFSAISGGTALFTLVFFRKQEKRLKNAEAVEKEVSTLRSLVDTLRENQRFYEERLQALQRLSVEKDGYIETLTRDKHVLEVKHSKNKSAINTVYECTFCDNTAKCPVLIRKTKNDEEYLQEITKPSNV